MSRLKLAAFYTLVALTMALAAWDVRAETEPKPVEDPVLECCPIARVCACGEAP